MKKKTRLSLLRSIIVLGFTAILCACVYLPPKELSGTFQNFIAILAGLVLGGFQGAGAAGLFMLLGVLGIPVFIGRTGGMEAFTGEMAGLTWGLFLASAVAGIIMGTPHTFEKKPGAKGIIKLSLVALLSYVLFYIPEFFWHRYAVLSNSESALHQTFLSFSTGQQFQYTIRNVILPNLPMDFIKLVVTIPLSLTFRPLVAQKLYPSDKEEEQELIEAMKKKKEILDKITGNKK